MDTLYTEDFRKYDSTWTNRISNDQREINNWVIPQLNKQSNVLFVGTGNSSLALEAHKLLNYIDGVTIIQAEFDLGVNCNLSNYNMFYMDKYSDDLLNLPNKYEFIVDNGLACYAKDRESFIRMMNNYLSLLDNNGKIVSNLAGLAYSYQGSQSGVNSLDTLRDTLQNFIKTPLKVTMETNTVFSISPVSIKNKVFIDCGAHCGESILEAKRRFGNETKIYSFEANTNLAEKLIDYFKDDSNVTVENKAVWIEDSFIEFYLSTSWSDGSSVYKEKNSGGISENVLLKIPCIDLSSFINSFDKDDYIVLKLDVEGAEYEILSKMIDDGTIRRVNELHGEFHPNKIDKPELKILENKVNNYLKENNIVFNTWELVGNSPKAIDRNIWKDKYEMKKITFVLPSRNNLEFLQLAYKSIRDLKTQHDILVLDDASIDGTQDWIKSLNDENLITYYNPGPERIGIVGMFDKGIEMARTEIIFAFHADMVASPNLDVNILKHLKQGVVVSATRVEPPLHPSGPEKITLDLGDEVEKYNYESNKKILLNLERNNKDEVTEGIFAPWCMYKSDYLAIGGHDELFAPQSKEDSDLFNRFVLNGYKVIQSWDGLVYHFTSRGSRFNKHAGGGTGKNSDEWLQTTNKNARNFIRKWGHFVKHDQYMKPIIPHKYDIAFKVNNCTPELLTFLEPWCSVISSDASYKDYLELEQPHTKYDLMERVLPWNAPLKNDIIIEFDASKLNQNNFSIIQQLPDIITESGEIGEFELDIFKLSIRAMNTLEHTLINIYNK